jgi:transcription elongation factor S-II
LEVKITLYFMQEKLEERLVQYKNKNDMLLREMSSTEAQMRQLLDERSTFTQKEVCLHSLEIRVPSSSVIMHSPCKNCMISIRRV